MPFSRRVGVFRPGRVTRAAVEEVTFRPIGRFTGLHKSAEGVTAPP